MKQIVHLIFTLEVGGSENMMIDIANEQAQYADVSIILINNKFSAELIRRINPSVNFFSLRREEGNKRSIRFLIKLWTLLLRKRPDVIHCHNHQIIRLLPFYKSRAVLTVHCVKIPSMHFARYKKVYSISEAVAAEVKKRSGISSTVVTNGINFRAITIKSMEHVTARRDINLFDSSPASTSTHNPVKSGTKSRYADTAEAESLQADLPTIRLVQLARLKHEMKGQDLLLVALRQLLDHSPDHQFTVDFIGSGKSEAYLRSMTADLGLTDFVSFLGDKQRSWIYNNLHSYDILVHPSRYEGFGLAMIEGIAAGLPVIASDEPGPRELLSGKPTAHLFSSGNANDLAEVIRKLSHQIRVSGINQLCEVSRSIANEQYSVQQTALQYMSHYSTDLKQRNN